MDIIEYLKHGNESAKHLVDLCKETNTCSDTIKKQIRNARLDGTPVCSNKDGYFISTERADIMESVRNLESQAKTRLESARALRKIVERIERSASIEDC